MVNSQQSASHSMWAGGYLVGSGVSELCGIYLGLTSGPSTHQVYITDSMHVVRWLDPRIIPDSTNKLYPLITAIRGLLANHAIVVWQPLSPADSASRSALFRGREADWPNNLWVPSHLNSILYQVQQRTRSECAGAHNNRPSTRNVNTGYYLVNDNKRDKQKSKLQQSHHKTFNWLRPPLPR